jgi:hypothetical protein
LLSLVRSTRALQDCSDRVLAEPAAHQPVAQTSLCQLEDLLSHVAPLGWEHIGITGDYVWSTKDQPRAGALKQLRRRQSLLAA